MQILVIDDDTSILDLVEKFLTRHGYQVTRAENGNEGMQKLTEESISLVISDLEMPGSDGFDFLKKKNALKQYEHIPVIFLTAHDNIDDKINAWNDGVSAYLTKPIVEAELLAIVNSLSRQVSNYQGEAMQAGGQTPPNSLFIKSQKSIIKVDFKDIIYIESAGDYTYLKTTTQSLKTYTTLKDLEKTLPETEFIRIHRSYIISLAHINEIKGNEISIAGTALPIGKTYREKLLKRIQVV